MTFAKMCAVRGGLDGRATPMMTEVEVDLPLSLVSCLWCCGVPHFCQQRGEPTEPTRPSENPEWQLRRLHPVPFRFPFLLWKEL